MKKPLFLLIKFNLLFWKNKKYLKIHYLVENVYKNVINFFYLKWFFYFIMVFKSGSYIEPKKGEVQDF